MTQITLFSIGNALVDREYAVDDAFLQRAQLHKGTMQLCDSRQQAQLVQHLAQMNYKVQASGGSAANTTAAFAALGGSSFYACRVGNDELARFYLHDLKQAGVQVAEKSLSQGQTGTCVVMITPDGERTMYTHLGITAELSPEQVDYEVLKQAKWLYIEGFLATSPTAQQAVQQARNIARQHQVKIAISLSDPAMVQYAREGLDQLLGDGVDLLFCNEQEALMYTKALTIEHASAQLLDIAKVVVITLGGKGALIGEAGHAIQLVVGDRVTAVDSNGAGDAFAGGFLYALSQGKTLEQAAKLGNRVAATVVSQYGPRLRIEQYQDIARQFA